MSDTQKTPAHMQPFRSVTADTGGLAGGFATMEEAKRDAGRRNERAEVMGITTRYNAIAEPA